MNKTTKSILKEVYQKREKDAKKYDYGLVLVIGGSEYYSGAPALAGLAAFRTGADMVRVIAPERAANIIASFSPVLAALDLPGEQLLQHDVAVLLSRTKAAQAVAKKKTAVVIGSGLGRSKETQEAIRQYLEQVENVPVIIDADAIYAVAEKPTILLNKPFIVTPHAHEFMVLTQQDLRGMELEQRMETVRQEAKRLHTTILLKGAVDIVSDGDEVWTNETGSSYMTAGGTGDTLAGVIAALAAREVPLTKAAAAGAYINGRAGEMAGKKFGESLIATDIIETIPEAIA